MSTNYILKQLDEQFLKYDFEDEGEFNRWQWGSINYYGIGNHIDLSRLDETAENYRGKGGEILRSILS